eukprot:gb/GEZN01005242.1/.p1 GENE.gb/GEZN01005242.1/~~gb/GEZN01005242.1/.p1  ORF type:complete len:517 (+),score=52.17 gb/GEZN01005242.1/:62-1612(+)
MDSKGAAKICAEKASDVPQPSPSSLLAIGLVERNPDLKGSTDTCSVCYENLAEMKFRCTHRILCFSCANEMDKRARAHNMQPVCPACRSELGAGELRRYDQIDSVTVGDAMATLEVRVNDAQDPAFRKITPDDIRAARGEILPSIMSFKEGTLTGAELVQNLMQMSPRNRAIAHAYLLKSVKLDDVVAELSGTEHWDDLGKAVTRHTFEGVDNAAYGLRALVGTGLGFTWDYLTLVAASPAVASRSATVASSALGSLATTLATFQPADLASSSLALSIFLAVDLYRWSTNQISMGQVALNFGEHVTGVGSGLLGSLAGAKLGVALGLTTGPAAPVCIPIFCLLAALLTGWCFDSCGRFLYRETTPVFKKLFADAHDAALNDAAKELGVDLNRDNARAVRRAFQNQIIKIHPDKNGNSKESHEKTIKAIAAWNILRSHYHNEILAFPTDRAEPLVESRVTIYSMYVWEKMRNSWKNVRTWVEPKVNAPVSTEDMSLPAEPTAGQRKREFIVMREIFL